jgi:hypothetical protein
VDKIREFLADLDGAERSSEDTFSVALGRGVLHATVGGFPGAFTLHTPLITAERRRAGYREIAKPRIEARRPLKILLRREGTDDAKYVASGMAKEVATGDAEFDRAIYVESDCDDTILNAVLNADVRAATMALFRLHRGSLTLNSIIVDDEDGCVTARWMKLGKGTGEVDREWVSAAVSKFSAFCASLPEIMDAGRMSHRLLPRAVRAAQYASLVGLFLVAGFLGSGPRISNGALLTGFLLGGIASAVLVVACYILIRGHSDSPETRAGAMVACFFLPVEICLILTKLCG